MHIGDHLTSPAGNAPLILAAGCFDGVHRGHQAVIRTAVQQAQATGGTARVLTFHPHPAKVLNPNTAPPLLSAWPLFVARIEALGVEGIFRLPFTREFAACGARSFLEQLKTQLPCLGAFVIGEDWTFGRHGKGGLDELHHWGEKSGIQITAVPAILHEGHRISSTWLRHAVLAGELETATKLLGRPFALYGRVVTGRGVGRELGFPTANLEVENEVRPPPGIYAAHCLLDGKEQPAAAYIGSRRTFHNIGPEQVLEVHLLEGSTTLYGRDLEVRFIRKIRDDQRFDSVDALKKQIALDLHAVQTVLANHPSSNDRHD
jgi:riboflavin kinase / FMN adenylyltransferase